MKQQNDVVMPAGNENKGRGFCVADLEKALSKHQVQVQRKYRYSELCRSNSVGAVSSRVKAIRNSDGKIDVLATFQKARQLTATVQYME